METITRNIPVLALRGLTAFPGQTVSFDAERDISIFALDNAMENDRRLLAMTQKDLSTAEPGEENLYTIGTEVQGLINEFRVSFIDADNGWDASKFAGADHIQRSFYRDFTVFIIDDAEVKTSHTGYFYDSRVIHVDKRPKELFTIL